MLITFSAFSQEKLFVKEVTQTLKNHILDDANWAMQQKPVTVTAEICARSAGIKHDFCSEGDYWWPDSLNPNGAYIQRDGLTNPENFVAQTFLVFGATAFGNQQWLGTLKNLDHAPKVEEVIRNLPIRSPVIWCDFDKSFSN